MAGKVSVNSSYAYRLVHPMHAVLVSCLGTQAGSKPNIIAVAWIMPTSMAPPLVAISISPQRHSHKLIEESGEFVINIPTLELLQSTYSCGTFSGRSFDKFKKAGLTPMPSKKVKAPAIKECIAHLECIVEDQTKTGDHSVFVGKIVEAYADPGVFTENYDLKTSRLLLHLGGNTFTIPEPKTYKP